MYQLLRALRAPPQQPSEHPGNTHGGGSSDGGVYRVPSSRRRLIGRSGRNGIRQDRVANESAEEQHASVTRAVSADLVFAENGAPSPALRLSRPHTTEPHSTAVAASDDEEEEAENEGQGTGAQVLAMERKRTASPCDVVRNLCRAEESSLERFGPVETLSAVNSAVSSTSTNRRIAHKSLKFDFASKEVTDGEEASGRHANVPRGFVAADPLSLESSIHDARPTPQSSPSRSPQLSPSAARQRQREVSQERGSGSRSGHHEVDEPEWRLAPAGEKGLHKSSTVSPVAAGLTPTGRNPQAERGHELRSHAGSQSSPAAYIEKARRMLRPGADGNFTLSEGVRIAIINLVRDSKMFTSMQLALLEVLHTLPAQSIEAFLAMINDSHHGRLEDQQAAASRREAVSDGIHIRNPAECAINSQSGLALSKSAGARARHSTDDDDTQSRSDHLLRFPGQEEPQHDRESSANEAGSLSESLENTQTAICRGSHPVVVAPRREQRHDEEGDGTASSSHSSSRSSSVGTRRDSTLSSSSSRKTNASILDYGFQSFVSDLALSSFQLSVHDEPVVLNVDVDTALLFIDISGYSSISTALESKGAHELFSTVNAYISMLVDVVVGFNGKVVKFAGDAIEVVWYYADLKMSVCAALHCALELQRRCGRFDIEGTDRHFSIHIGLVSGRVRSTVFRSATVKHMQSTYDLLSGKPLQLIGDVVDAARPGEICVSGDVLEHACAGLRSQLRATGDACNIFLIESVDEAACVCPPTVHQREVATQEGCSSNVLEHAIGGETELDLANRLEHIAGFVPPKIASQLRKGKTQSEMAEMRLLTVLFIHKSDAGIDMADWFEEVQHVIDDYRCAIVQCIEDDKGVHIIAAVNLFNADREPAITGIRIANSLVQRQCGCTIGLATGLTFCGVVGNTAAARFDITGWACVRACRMMQYALSIKQPVAIGESVVQYSGDLSQTTPLGTTFVKGTQNPISVYAIAQVDTSILSSITTAGTACPAVHERFFQQLQTEIVKGSQQRVGCVVRGSSNSGKHTLCARTLYGTGIVAFTHIGVQESRPLDLLWTIAWWFSYHRDPELSATARSLLSGLRESHNIRSTAIALSLISLAIAKGFKNAVIVRHCQRLDAMSLSFVRQVLQQQPTQGEGRFIVMATVVPQTGAQAWSAIATLMGPRTLTFRVGHLSNTECAAFIKHRLRWSCDDALHEAIMTAAGRLVGLIDSVVSRLEALGAGKLTVTSSGKLHATEELRMQLFMLHWQSISRQICAKSAQIFGGLMLSASAVLKVVAILSNPFIPVNRLFAAAVATKIVTGVKSKKVLKEIELLVDMYILEKRGLSAGATRRSSNFCESVHTTFDRNSAEVVITDEFVEFDSPASLSVVMETVLPSERVSVAQEALTQFEDFHELESPEEYLAYACHFHNAGRPQDYHWMLQEGLSLLDRLGAKWTPDEIRRLRLLLAVDARHRGHRTLTVELSNRAGVGGDRRHDAPPAGASSPLEQKSPQRRRVSCSPLHDVRCVTQATGPKRMTTIDLDEINLELGQRDDGGMSGDAGGCESHRTRIVARELPPHIVKLRNWRPPVTFGALNLPLRLSAIFITELAINAAMQQPTSEGDVKANWARINLFSKFKEQIDRVVGFEAPIANEKEFLIRVGTPTSDFAEVCRYGREYLQYIDDVVQPRADRVMQHVLSTMYVPFPPSYKPVFVADERVSLETALRSALKNWANDPAGSLRDGLMELATSGWTPKNAEQNLEAQRDFYLRKRTQKVECFLCLLFVNLSISTI